MSDAGTAIGEGGRDHIRDVIRADVAAGRVGTVVTRFPPEPNGHLHIGHAKSICLNFGVAREFGGRCHLRFDDTNPVKEELEYIESIQRDVRWLGFDWDGHLHFASDNFEQLYDWAEHLIGAGKAYVDDLSADEIRAHRGTLTEPGRDSPYRDRTAEESLDLFRRMRAGEFADGARVLRARIDMASGNINMRDPVLYRILHARHPRTGDDWCLYPTYDFAHGQSDAIEGVTHSLCTLAFADPRPLYDWLVDTLPVPSRPRPAAFSRLTLSSTVPSKRKPLPLAAVGPLPGLRRPLLPAPPGHNPPPPQHIPPNQGRHPETLEPTSRNPSDQDPFSAIAFKTVADKYGDLTYLRVYSGTAKSNARVYNASKDRREKFNRLYRMRADERIALTETMAGDIVAVVGLKFSTTGDTLCSQDHPIVFAKAVSSDTFASLAL